MVTKKKKAAKAQARAERENKERKRQEEEEHKRQAELDPDGAIVEEVQEEVDEDVVPEAPPKEKHYLWLAIISVPVAICCDLGSQPFIALIMAAVALGVYRWNQIVYEDQVASRIPFWCGVVCIVLAIGGWVFMALPAIFNTTATFS